MSVNMMAASLRCSSALIFQLRLSKAVSRTWGAKSTLLNQKPRRHHIGYRDLVNVRPLPLGEVIVHSSLLNRLLRRERGDPPSSRGRGTTARQAIYQAGRNSHTRLF